MVSYSYYNPYPGTAISRGGFTNISTQSGVIRVPTSIYQQSTSTTPAQITTYQAPTYQPISIPKITTALSPISQLGSQFAQKYPLLAQKIYSPFEQATAGLQYGFGRDSIVQQFAPTRTVKPFSEYATANLYQATQEKSADYLRWLQNAMPVSSRATQMDAPRKFVYGVAKTPATIIDTSGMLALGGEYIFREPKQALRGIPVGAGTLLGGTALSLKERGPETVGEFAGMMLLGKAGGELPKIRTIPKSRTKFTFEPEIVKPVETPTLLPEKAIKLEAGLKLAKEFEKTSPIIKQPLDFKNIRSLPGKSGKQVEMWIKTHPEQNPVVGGSGAARAQFRDARVPGDLDMFVKNPSKAGQELYKLVVKELGKENVRFTDKKSGFLIEVKDAKTGEWHNSIDLHKSVRVGTEFDLGFKTQPPIRIDGIKYISAAEQLQRKAAGALQPLKLGQLGPKPHRMKDVRDFEFYSNDIIKHRFEKAAGALLFKSIREKRVAKLEKTLKTYQFHSYLGPDIYTTRAVLKGYGELPAPIRAGISLAAIGSQYPQYGLKPSGSKIDSVFIPKPGYPLSYPKMSKVSKSNYPVPSTPKIKEPSYYPSYKPETKKSSYYPPTYPETIPGTTYYPPYKSEDKTEPYYPPYYPDDKLPYEPPDVPSHKPPIIPETVKKPQFEKKRKKQIKRKGKKPDYSAWLLENRVATVQQMLKGRNPLRMPEKVKNGKK